MIGENFYKRLPGEFLVQFYNELKLNIDNEVVTTAMYNELGLIREAAFEKNILLPEIPEHYIKTDHIHMSD